MFQQIGTLSATSNNYADFKHRLAQHGSQITSASSELADHETRIEALEAGGGGGGTVDPRVDGILLKTDNLTNDTSYLTCMKDFRVKSDDPDFVLHTYEPAGIEPAVNIITTLRHDVDGRTIIQNNTTGTVVVKGEDISTSAALEFGNNITTHAVIRAPTSNSGPVAINKPLQVKDSIAMTGSSTTGTLSYNNTQFVADVALQAVGLNVSNGISAVAQITTNITSDVCTANTLNLTATSPIVKMGSQQLKYDNSNQIFQFSKPVGVRNLTGTASGTLGVTDDGSSSYMSASRPFAIYGSATKVLQLNDLGSHAVNLSIDQVTGNLVSDKAIQQPSSTISTGGNTVSLTATASGLKTDKNITIDNAAPSLIMTTGGTSTASISIDATNNLTTANNFKFTSATPSIGMGGTTSILNNGSQLQINAPLKQTNGSQTCIQTINGSGQLELDADIYINSTLFKLLLGAVQLTGGLTKLTIGKKTVIVGSVSEILQLQNGTNECQIGLNNTGTGQLTIDRPLYITGSATTGLFISNGTNVSQLWTDTSGYLNINGSLKVGISVIMAGSSNKFGWGDVSATSPYIGVSSLTAANATMTLNVGSLTVGKTTTTDLLLTLTDVRGSTYYTIDTVDIGNGANKRNRSANGFVCCQGNNYDKGKGLAIESATSTRVELWVDSSKYLNFSDQILVPGWRLTNGTDTVMATLNAANDLNINKGLKLGTDSMNFTLNGTLNKICWGDISTGPTIYNSSVDSTTSFTSIKANGFQVYSTTNEPQLRLHNGATYSQLKYTGTNLESDKPFKCTGTPTTDAFIITNGSQNCGFQLSSASLLQINAALSIVGNMLITGGNTLYFANSVNALNTRIFSSSVTASSAIMSLFAQTVKIGSAAGSAAKLQLFNGTQTGEIQCSVGSNRIESNSDFGLSSFATKFYMGSGNSCNISANAGTTAATVTIAAAKVAVTDLSTTNFTSIETAVQSTRAVGEIFMCCYAAGNPMIPLRMVEKCNGAAFSSASYPELYLQYPNANLPNIADLSTNIGYFIITK